VWLLVIRWVAFWWLSSLVLVPGHPTKAEPMITAPTRSVAVNTKIKSFLAALATVVMQIMLNI
jgi:hypothetical protein